MMLRQLRYIRRLTVVLCAICIVQLAVISPGLAQPVPPDAATATATAADSSVEVAREAGGDERKPASSPTISSTSSTEEPNAKTLLSRFDPSISTYYARSVADPDTSDFGHSSGFIGAVDFNVMPSLVLSTDLTIYREYGEEYERWVASNWSFSATRTFELPPAGVVYPTFFFNLPTNSDDREYLSYRGSLGVDVELRKFNFYEFSEDHAFGGSVGSGTSRNFYEHTTSEGLSVNRIWQVSGYASLSYKFRRSLVFVLKFTNNWRWQAEGARTDDLYRLSARMSYSPVESFWLGLSTVSADRTFLYDQVTSNVALYDARATSVVFSLTYVPRLSATNELSR